MKTLRLIDLSGGHLDLKRVEAPAEYLATDVTRIREGTQRGFLIQMAINPLAPAGRFVVPVTLHTNLARQPRIDVIVTGNISTTQPRPDQHRPEGQLPPAPPAKGLSQNLFRDEIPVERGSGIGPEGRSLYVTRMPTEEDTYVAAWLIKRFVDPNAEFSFVAPEAPMPDGPGTLFDLPSPRARWSRSARGCTSEQILAGVKGADPGVKAIVACVRRLEIAPWLVQPGSDAAKLRARMQAIAEAGPDPQARLVRAFAILDEICKPAARAAGKLLPDR
jgi:hypothetical protein